MAEENIGDNGEGESKPDPIVNLKSELLRKNENISNELSALKQQLAEMNQNMVRSRQQAPQKEEDEIDPIIDPKGYKEKIKREMRSEFQQQTEMQNQKNNVLGSLVNQFPELADANSELTKSAIEAYNNLTDAEKALPSSYKLAVTSAAADLGLVAVNKRKSNNNQNDESFTVNSSRGSGQNNRSQKNDDIDEKTLAFAELLGRPVNDKKYLESLKKSVNRKKWSRYE